MFDEFIEKIKSGSISKSEIASFLHDISSKGLKQKPVSEDELSVYEAFLLWELGERVNYAVIGNGYAPAGMFFNALNLALMAKLFDDEGLYNYYREKALSFYSSNSDRISSGYLTSDLNSLLDCNAENLKKLGEYRHDKKKKSGQEYHYNYFPFEFDFETALIEKLETKASYPESKKEISPQICELIAKIEMLIDEF